MARSIAFVGPGDPDDVRTYSGVPHFALNALRAASDRVVNVNVHSDEWSPLTLRLNRYAERLTGKRVLLQNLRFERRRILNDIRNRIERERPSCLICLNVDPIISDLEVDLPIIHNSDTTFRAIENYYPDYRDVWSFGRRGAHRLTGRALARSAYCSFPSEWAARSAREHYGIPPDRIAVIPYGANLAEVPEPRDPGARDHAAAPRFLFIGRDWERKGGRIAFETMLALREAGIDASMTAVGCDPGISHPNLEVISFLNKQKPGDLARYRLLWREATVLFMPSRQETFGAVYSEAAAWGVPVIACDTGGVAGCVVDGQTGRLLPPDAAIGAYVAVALELLGATEDYARMCRNARRRYETVLNWDAWARSLLALAERATG